MISEINKIAWICSIARLLDCTLFLWTVAVRRCVVLARSCRIASRSNETPALLGVVNPELQ
jgi:hypothetical protein